ALVEDGRLPLGIGRHLAVRGTAGDELDLLIVGAHRLGSLVGEAAILMGGFVAHLPGAVHLVAEAPDPDNVRREIAVLEAEVAPVGAAGMVAVSEEGAGGMEIARAEIDREHHLGTGRLAPAGELVGTDRIGLARPPGEVEAHRALLAWADAVLPVI